MGRDFNNFARDNSPRYSRSAERAMEVTMGQPIEFICGCGAHPSVMVCDGKVIGTSA